MTKVLCHFNYMTFKKDENTRRYRVSAQERNGAAGLIIADDLTREEAIEFCEITNGFLKKVVSNDID